MSVKAIILIIAGSLAANGIACACPVVAMDADKAAAHRAQAHQHDQHPGSAHEDGDCAAECDYGEMRLGKSERSLHARIEATNKSGDDSNDVQLSLPEFPSPTLFAEFTHPTSIASRDHARPTPVSRHERMLD